MTKNYFKSVPWLFAFILFVGTGIMNRASAQYILTRIAGNNSHNGVSAGDGIPATSTPVGAFGFTTDTSGNIYIADDLNYYVRKINASGIITKFAGQKGIHGYSGIPGPATACTLFAPVNVARDAAGNIYFTDQENFRILKVNSAGNISVFAGGGSSTSNGVPATSAALYYPDGMAFNSAGDLILSDQGHATIRKISASTGLITTIAGGGTDYTHDGISALSAQIAPAAIGIDASDNVYFSNWNNGTIRKISTSGIITTAVGHFPELGFGGDGGPATAATINNINGIGFDPDGNMFISDPLNYRIRKVSTSGIITTVAGSGANGGVSGTYYQGDGTAATAANLYQVHAIHALPDGSILFGDPYVGFVFKLTPPPHITGTTSFCIGTTTTLNCTTTGGTWSSSNTAIATVNSATGVVTGVAAGAATITYSVGSSNYTAPVTVNALASISAGTITGNANMSIGEVRMLADAVSGGTWSVDATGIATIGSTGAITGISEGTATVSYTVTGSCAIGVATANILVSTTDIASVCEGGTVALSILPAGGTWSSSSPANATVNATTGVVTGILAGVTNVIYSSPLGTTVTTNVTVIGAPAPISGTLSVCAGATTTLTETAVSGTWSASNSHVTVAGGVVTGVSAGTSVITYQFASGCYTTATVTVNAAPAAITGTTNVCTGYTSALSNTTTGGTWTSGTPAVATVGPATGIVTAVTAGAATITYSAGGCMATTGVTVATSPAAITGTVSICNYATTTLASSTPGGLWTSSNSNATVNASGVVTGAAAGTATISYTYATGCYRAAVVTVNPAPAAITGTASVCVGNTTTLNETTTGGAWTSGTASVATIGTTGVVTGVAAGVATISYTAGGCRATIAVSVSAAPAAITGVLSVCQTATTALADATSGGAWTSSNTNAGISAGGVVTGAVAGTAVVSYTLANGCYKTAIATVNTTPAPISGNAPVCSGTTLALGETTTGGTWTSSTTGVATIGSTGIVTGVAAGTANISYTLGTCRATKTVTVIALPAAITGTATVCTGLTTTLTATTTGGTWSSSNGNATAGSSGIVTGVTAGIVTISYTMPTGCSKTYTVTVNQTPAAITGNSPACAGATMALGETTTGGVWSSNTNSVATVGSTGIVTAVAAGVSTISYTLGACRSTTVVTVNAIPAAIAGTATACEGATTTLTETTTGGTWSSSAGNATVDASGIVTGAAAGTATISYTLSTGCYKTKQVTINTTPATITGGSTVCPGTTLSLGETTTGGTWASSTTGVATVATTGVVTGIAAGVANISYTLGTCRTIKTVTVNPLPAAITGTATVCEGGTTALADTTTGGTWSSSASNATVGTSGIVTGVAAGTATISYTMGTGCYKLKPVTINPTPAAITGNSAVCAGSTLSLGETTTGGTWSSSTTGVASIGSTGTVTAVAAGVSTISYTLGACRSTTVVSVNALPAAITGTATVCEGSTTALADITTGGTWSSSASNATVDTSGIVTGVAAGTATISYTSGAGCYKTKPLTINATPAAITGSGAVCSGSTLSLGETTTGGTWNSSTTSVATIGSTGTVTAVAAGVSTISYTLGTCRTTTVVSVNALPAAITGAATVCEGATTALADITTGGTWSSSASNATIDTSGIVTGITTGAATISYTTSTGCYKTKMVTVNATPAAITGNTNLCTGLLSQLADAVTGGSWTSGTTAVATIGTNGRVTGVGAGVSTISYSVGTCRATTVVTVTSGPAAITGTATTCPGATTALADATTGGTWSSSNAKATVGSTGVVTGVTSGLSVISYAISNGCYRTATVTINPLPNAGSLTGATSVVAGDFVALSLTGASFGGVFSSSDESVAVVNISAEVTGVDAGTANISYTVSNSCGTASSVLTITVTAAARPGSATTGVSHEGASKADVSLFPNPSNGMINVKSAVAGTFRMYAFDGKEIGTYQVAEGTTSITFPDGLAAGVYIGRFVGNDDSIVSFRIVKN